MIEHCLFWSMGLIPTQQRTEAHLGTTNSLNPLSRATDNLAALFFMTEDFNLLKIAKTVGVTPRIILAISERPQCQNIEIDKTRILRILDNLGRKHYFPNNAFTQEE